MYDLSSPATVHDHFFDPRWRALHTSNANNEIHHCAGHPFHQNNPSGEQAVRSYPTSRVIDRSQSILHMHSSFERHGEFVGLLPGFQRCQGRCHERTYNPYSGSSKPSQRNMGGGSTNPERGSENCSRRLDRRDGQQQSGLECRRWCSKHQQSSARRLKLAGPIRKCMAGRVSAYLESIHESDFVEGQAVATWLLTFELVIVTVQFIWSRPDHCCKPSSHQTTVLRWDGKKQCPTPKEAVLRRGNAITRYLETGSLHRLLLAKLIERGHRILPFSWSFRSWRVSSNNTDV